METLRSAQLVGVPTLLKLRKGYKNGWDDLFDGYMNMSAMHGLLAVGFLDELQAKGSVNPEAFAKAADLDAGILEPLCEALYSSGMFERDNGSYRLSERGDSIVSVLRGWLEVSYGYSEVFRSLPDLLRKKKVYGKDFYRKSDYVATGSGEMEKWLFFPLANQAILDKKYKRVLDLGCGDGTFLRELCKLNSEAKCYGIDLAPDAIEEGKRRAKKAGLENRISLVAADVQDVTGIPEEFRTVEVATIFFVLHEILYLGEDKLIAFLQAYKRNFPNVPLMAFEAIRPTADQMRNRPGVAIYYYLYHDLTHQKPVSREEWRRLFDLAGCKLLEERYMDFARTAVFTIV